MHLDDRLSVEGPSMNSRCSTRRLFHDRLRGLCKSAETVDLGMKRASRLATVGKATLLALGLMVAAEMGRVAVGLNFNTVVQGRCYRCGQPSADELRMLVRTYGIRSIVNMRGFDEKPWYEEERETAERLGVQFGDAGIWSATPPTEA